MELCPDVESCQMTGCARICIRGTMGMPPGTGLEDEKTARRPGVSWFDAVFADEGAPMSMIFRKRGYLDRHYR